MSKGYKKDIFAFLADDFEPSRNQLFTYFKTADEYHFYFILNKSENEQQQQVLVMLEASVNLSCITEREAFSSGFILATRIMVEVMQGLEELEDILGKS